MNSSLMIFLVIGKANEHFRGLARLREGIKEEVAQ